MSRIRVGLVWLILSGGGIHAAAGAPAVAADAETADPGTRMVIETGMVTGRLRGPRDHDCDDPDEGATRFLDCIRPSGHDLDQASFGALGFEQRLAPDWWSHFRVGAFGNLTVSARVQEAEDSDPEAVRYGLSGQYALAGLRRDFGSGGAGFNPFVSAGAGLARLSLRDMEREQNGERWQAPDGDRTGYILRLESGLAWRTRGGMEFALSLRHDHLDGFGSPAEAGTVIPEDGEAEERDFEATTGRGSLQAAVLALALPLN